jgi:A/G-specific adenine glycosylase
MKKNVFTKLVKDYYKKSGRYSLPWRHTRNPYHILVSEIMLQQTQVSRVISKYEEFISIYPTADTLARAKTSDVLRAWQGLGYNRRALNLKKTCKIVVKKYKGQFPATKTELESLPGIGQSTSGAILAYIFNVPAVFIETNIRSVYIHHFFKNNKLVHDRDILPLIEETIDTKNPRDWYYALMDYGVHLKQTLPNPSRRSLHYAKQTSFKGSNREVRSKIIKLVLKGPVTRKEIIDHIGDTLHDVNKNIQDLIKEGFIRIRGNRFISA